ncbi:MAG: hypothetical protein Q4C70_01880, partial [Planctomycetia bacterium]|nr:hypothetical protein [Planctomycetia bacterium]
MPTGMPTGAPTHQMPPQQPMGSPVPPQAPATSQTSVPPIPPVTPPTRSTVSKKYNNKKAKNDPTMMYVGIGGAVVVLVLALLLLSPSGKEDESQEVADVPTQQAETPDNSFNEEDVDDFSLTNEAEAELPPRPVQENVMGDQTTPANAKTDAADDDMDDDGMDDADTDDGNTGKKTKKSKNDAFMEDNSNEVDSFIIPTHESETDDDGDSNAEDVENESDDDMISETDDDNETDDADENGKTKKKNKKTTLDSNDEDDEESVSGEDKKSTKTKRSRNNRTSKDEESNDEADSAQEVTEEDIKNIGHGASLRLDPKRKMLCQFYGAESNIQDIITDGVDWILDKQLKEKNSACWCFDHTMLSFNKRRPGQKNLMNPGMAKENLVSATALSIMAILGSGDLPPKERASIGRAINFLQMQSMPASDRMIPPIERESARLEEASLVVEKSLNPSFHPHAWGTIAVCDYVAMEKARREKKDKFLNEISVFGQALVLHVCRQQNLSDGGFPQVERGLTVDCTLVSPRSEHASNIISTVWNLMALRSARDAGLNVPNETIMKATDYLSKKVTAIGRTYKNYMGLKTSDLREIRAALFGLQLFSQDYPTYDESAQLAAQILRIYDAGQLQPNLFTTLFVRDLRGDSWENWRNKVCTQYAQEQETSKFEKGSWYYDGDRVNMEGGRLYCTAMTLLILEGYYRYEPLRPLEEYAESTEALLKENPDMVRQPENGEAFALPRSGDNSDDDANAEDDASTTKQKTTEPAPEQELEPFMDTSNMEFESGDDDDDDDE